MSNEKRKSRQLLVDEESALFNTDNMRFREFPSVFLKIREYTREIIAGCEVSADEMTILEQQVSEIIKNAVVHGNNNAHERRVRVWYNINSSFAHLIVEDQGSGFTGLSAWNEFYRRRNEILSSPDGENIEKYISWYSYRGEDAPQTGGVALISAIEYWNCGIVFNNKKNKIGLFRKF